MTKERRGWKEMLVVLSIVLPDIQATLCQAQRGKTQ